MKEISKGDTVRIIGYGHKSFVHLETFIKASLEEARISARADRRILIGTSMDHDSLDYLIDEDSIRDGMKIIGTDGCMTVYDSMPEIVGQTGTVTDIDGDKYAISGISGKTAWYYRDQIELTH